MYLYKDKGNSRTVFVFKSFVIKIPRIAHSFFEAKKLFKNPTPKGPGFLHYREFFRFVEISFSSIGNNWLEFLFYLKYRHSFCAKTYFSFFGFFNIQERCIVLVRARNFQYKNIDEFRKRMLNATKDYPHDYSGGNYIYPHVFNNPQNFGFIKNTNRFVCVDYSDELVRKNILGVGDNIQEIFKDFKP